MRAWRRQGAARAAARHLPLIVGVLLAACGRAPAPGPVAALRDPAAPVGAQVDAGLARLAGDWQVVAGQGAGVAPGMTVTIGAGEVRLGDRRLPLVETGPGRFALDGAPLWVHWLDADARTAALGAPDGTLVMVLDRTGQPGERLDAALSILDWYGYDIAGLGSRAP